MNINIGFICSNFNGKISTNHSFKLKNLKKEKVLLSLKKNLEDLVKLLSLSKELNCKIFRLGSQFIPFFSHPSFKREWLKDAEIFIKEFLPEIKKFDIRITMHPGQFVVLSTENKDLLKKSLKEIEYHFWVLEKLERDENSVVVIHGGGTYGNKEKAKRVLIQNLKNERWLKEKLALENDEKSYNSKDILKVCQETGLPFVFDFFHHNLNRIEVDFREVFKTWKERVPEFHISSSREGARFSHGDFVKMSDFKDFLNLIRENKIDKTKRVDVLLEAKKKELAVKNLIRETGYPPFKI